MKHSLGSEKNGNLLLRTEETNTNKVLANARKQNKRGELGGRCESINICKEATTLKVRTN